MKKRKFQTACMVLAASISITVSGCSAVSEMNRTSDGTGTALESPEGQGMSPEEPAGMSGKQEETAAQQAVSPAKGSASAYVDDFYDAVNHDTLAGWEIPADQADMGWFRVLREDNYQKVDAIIREASSEADPGEGSDFHNIRALNLTGLDREARETGGYGDLAGTFLSKVDEAGTVEELLKECLRFNRNYGYYSLIGPVYMGDNEDSSVKSLYMPKPDTGLLREIWFAEDASSRNRVEEYKKYLKKLHEISGMSSREAGETVERVTRMMKDLASSSLKVEETYDAGKTNNVYTAKEAAALYSGALPMSLLHEIYGISEDEKTVVEEPGILQKLGTYLTDENLPLLKEYVKTCLYSDLSGMTGRASLEAAQEYQMAASGVEEKKSFERTVSETVQDMLGYQCGKVFCGTYFNEDSRQKVTDIIHQVIGVYDQRLGEMEWMTEETRREARKKLAAIMIKVGYPDQWPQDKYTLNLKNPEEGGLYIDNLLEIKRAQQDYAFRTRHDPVDKSEWGMTPQTVNAYYNPGNNEIVFPAGILQPPFYDADAAPVVNLGRIGVVIGHEITHAFDTSGSQYDEKGNLRDWWTEEDKKKFKELSQKVIDYYGAMEMGGIKVNGSLTATENIADLGAVSCVTEIAKMEGYDLKELYKAYAALWANKYRDSYLSYIMTTDPHSPGAVRTNAVLSATDDFYSAFGVREGDGMYQKPEDRPKIW